MAKEQKRTKKREEENAGLVATIDYYCFPTIKHRQTDAEQSKELEKKKNKGEDALRTCQLQVQLLLTDAASSQTPSPSPPPSPFPSLFKRGK